MTIKMTATYSDTWWESDEPDTDPCEESGYTDPSNPWGGFRYAVPDGLVGPAFVAWRDENAETVTFDNVTDAALFALDFPGGVWDFGDPCEPECVDYSTRRYREVTLHVTDGIYDLLVFAEMDRIESGRIEDVQRAINGSNPHGGDVRHSNVIRDANGALYEPWQGPNGEVGYRVTLSSQDVEYVYLNPSSEGDEVGWESNAFLYQGPNGDCSQDEALLHVIVGGDCDRG